MSSAHEVIARLSSSVSCEMQSRVLSVIASSSSERSSSTADGRYPSSIEWVAAGSMGGEGIASVSTRSSCLYVLFVLTDSESFNFAFRRSLDLSSG